MQMTKKVLSIVLAVMMVVSMMVVGAVSASAATVDVTTEAALRNGLTSGGTYRVPAGTTVSLTQSLDIPAGVSSTLYVNGTLDLTAIANYGFSNHGTLTLKGTGTYVSTKNVVDNFNKLTVSGGTFNVSGNAGFAFYNNPSTDCAEGTHAVMNVTYATIDAHNTPIGVFKDAEVTVGKDATIKSYWGYFAICGNGNPGNDGYKINIKDGATITAEEIAIYHCNNGELNISGGTITGDTAIYIKSGKTNITGGTIHSTGPKQGYVAYGGGAYSTGDAIVIERNDNYVGKGPSEVKISGGTIIADGHELSMPVASYKDNVVEGEIVSGFVTGGTFNKAIDDTLCDSSFSPVAQGDSFVVMNDNVAEVNGTPYGTFDAAVTVAGSTDTIKLLRNVEYAMAPNQTLKIDKNGYTFTATSTDSKYFADYSLSSGVYTYVSKPCPVAVYDSNGILVGYYKNIASGFSAAPNNGTVELLFDTSGNAPSAPNKTCTLDLKGHTYTVTGTGKLTTSNVWYDATNLTIKNGTIDCPNATTNYQAVKLSKGTLNIENATITAENGITLYQLGGTLNVNNGGKIKNTNGTAIQTHGNSSKDFVININDGAEVTSTNGMAIYQPGAPGQLNISGGTVSGKTGVYVKAGELNISGGTIRGTGDKADYKFNGSGAYSTGDALVIENVNYGNHGAPVVSITGGTFESANNKAVASYVKQDDSAQTGNFERIENVITGGKFSSDETPLVDNGFTVKVGAYYEIKSFDDFMITANDAHAQDSNSFGITNDYKYLNLLGVQKKDKLGAQAAKTSENKAQESGTDLRFVAVMSKEILDAADDYGFIVAKAGENKVTSNFAGKFDKVKANWGNGEKTISAKGTYNNVCGDSKYGEPDDTTTAYKYVTCAVNGMDSDDSVLARFYVKIGNTYYYSKYANTVETGCVAYYAALV